MMYNIFEIMNTTEFNPDEKISRIFRAISTPARIRILAAIGAGEACVCHLEALMDLRQSYISQQLMEMRDAGLVDTRRDGRYIFYRLTEPKLLDLLIDIGKLFGVPTEEMQTLLNTDPLPQCCCPDCLAQLNPTLIHQEEISPQK
jgi:DNA-binding transcriptional ArsR family regulator